LYIRISLLCLLKKQVNAMGILTAKQIIGPGSVVQRKSSLLFNEIDGEVVMLSIENSEYYGMDKVGSRIWQLLEKPMIFKELIVSLMDEYDVTEEQCTEDSIKFLEHLDEKKLIEIQ
jgi:hypothetical protein